MTFPNGITPAPAQVSPESFKPLLQKLIDHPEEFTQKDTTLAFHHLAAKDFGGCTPVQVGAFLMALKYSGKAQDDRVISAAAAVMREYATSVTLKDAQDAFVVDIVGTGGDGHNTFNVSTSAAIVAAGAGARVCKHGSKASTSSSGSADVLAALGCHLPPPSIPPKPLPNIPFIFLAAGNYHPAIGALAGVRKSLPFRTIFNVLGPLLNPARPQGMILGVYTKALGPVFARALRDGGVKRAMVVCGQEGLDEISIAGGTWVWDIYSDGSITESIIHPSHFGLPAYPLDMVAGSTPTANAETLTALLTSKPAPNLTPPASLDAIRDFVLMNAAALLVVAGLAQDFKEGVQLAQAGIANGKAWQAIEEFRNLSA